MYMSYNDIHNFPLFSEDENIGSLADLYVDDRDWAASFAVIETGGWFSSNKVLIRTVEPIEIDLDHNRLVTTLMQENIKNAPKASSRETVSEANEREWYLQPHASVYFAGAHGVVLPSMFYSEMPEADMQAQQERSEKDRHLRSMNEVTGYEVQATDGKIGTVVDFIIDPEDWRVAFLNIDTGNWLPGKLVIVAPEWAQNVSWSERLISFEMTKEQIEKSPTPSDLDSLQRSHREDLYLHYGYPI
ncbi:MAG: PRC-barrel domain-containing protein [Rhizobiaceae bacterium]|nr:PRC-barrel domain-containing protein [Rhizobiaceae bacterium]